MPLHPLAQAFLEECIAAGAQPICSMSVEEARRVSAEMFSSVPPGDPVARVEDTFAPGPGHDIPVRIYTPEGEAPFPILVYFHGGGWVVGDLDAQDADCRTIANAARCVVVSVDYRLAPEHKFPAAAEDAYSALCWAAKNSARLAGDGAPIAVGGTSAGANLAAVVALMARDRGGPPLACQVLSVPVTDCDFDTESYCQNGEEYVLTKAEMQWFWGHYLSTPHDGAHPYASPLRASDLSRLPPALIQTAEYDPLRDEGRAYADRLSAAVVPVTYRCYEGAIHMVLGSEAMSDAVSYLRERFRVEKNKQVVRDLYEQVFQKHDLSLVDRFVHDDYVQHNPALPKGKAGFIEFHVAFFSAIPDVCPSINGMLAEGDLVWVFNTLRGTHTGEGFLGLPPTGNKIEYDVVDMFRLRDGKLCDHWDVADTKAFFLQLGAIEEVDR